MSIKEKKKRKWNTSPIENLTVLKLFENENFNEWNGIKKIHSVRKTRCNDDGVRRCYRMTNFQDLRNSRAASSLNSLPVLSRIRLVLASDQL